MNFETELVQFEPAPGDPHHPTSTPIYQTATFRLEPGVEEPSYDYSRSGNPTRAVLENHLARLEGGQYGLAFSTGMAALDAVASLVPAGRQILAGVDLYGGTFRLLTQILSHRGIRARFCDTSDLEILQRNLTDQTSLVLIETPSNPLFRITDIAATAELVHDAGALLAIDNSLLSPFLQQPLQQGADLVVHSATKYLGGHGDVSAGALVTNSEEYRDWLAYYQNAVGTALAAFDCWLLLRGIQTLALRLSRQQENALQVARFLEHLEGVKKLHYPGLEGAEPARIHFGQARGGGALMSLETGCRELSERLVRALKLFSLTVSFGGVHSSVCLPTSMSHACIPPDVRAQRCFPEDLVRLSIGIEHPADLIGDLDQAFRHLRSGLLLGSLGQ